MDYRKITNLLIAKNQQFYARTIDEDEIIKAVIKGLLSYVKESEVQAELTELGFQINRLDRMIRKTFDGDSIPLPMMPVQVPFIAKSMDKSKDIYNLTHLQYYKISVEPKKIPNNVTQCHRC